MKKEIFDPTLFYKKTQSDTFYLVEFKEKFIYTKHSMINLTRKVGKIDD